MAIGDIHGDFDSFVALLRRAGLVDERLAWSGGTTTLVQTGDFTDRGGKVREVMDLLMALAPQAAQAGGRVVVLLGNHEVMNVMRDVRDVAPAAYAEFADAESAARQARAYREYADFIAARKAAGVTLTLRDRDEWMRTHPPGYIEYAEAFDSKGVYGRWLRSLPVLLTLGDTAFLHAGIDPNSAPRKLDDVNSRVRAEIKQFDEFRRHLIDRRLILPSFTLPEIMEVAIAEVRARKEGSGMPMWADDGFAARDAEVLAAVAQIGAWDSLRPDGPLWFRGFATWSDEEGPSQLRKLSDRYKVAHWVVGHTTTRTQRVTARFGSGVFLIDTGMLAAHESASALQIQDGHFTALALNPGTAVADDSSAVR